MVEQLGSGPVLVVSQQTVLYDPGVDGGMQEQEEILYYRYPDQFRSEAHGPGVEQIRVVNAEGALSVVDGKILGETEELFGHFKDLLLYRDTELLLERLSGLGIELKVVSLGRYKDKIAYVIGAKYPDESVPQVWIDKESFRPLRLILEGDGGGDAPLGEIEYSEHSPLGKTGFYPGRIQFFEDGVLMRMYVLKTLDMSAEVADQLFDVAYLKTMYEPISPTLPTRLPGSDLDEMKRSIEDFKKTFE